MCLQMHLSGEDSLTFTHHLHRLKNELVTQWNDEEKIPSQLLTTFNLCKTRCSAIFSEFFECNSFPC